MFKKFVSWLVLISFAFMSFFTSIEAVAGTSYWVAPPSGVLPTWDTFAADSKNWITMPNSKGFGNMLVYWPKDDFTQIGSMSWAPDPEDATKASLRWRMLDSEKWMRYGREDVGMKGIPSSLISDKINQFPKTSAYVFANYSPDSAELLIEVQKIEKQPNGTLAVFRGDFTPWHGEFNKWRRDYLTPSEAANPGQMGYNPFEKFKGATTDPVFHNISWEAAGVAIGEAMKRYDAHVAWIASDKTRFEQQTKKSGGLLRRKITINIDGYAKPQWFVGMPLGQQPMGGMSGICVTDVGAKNSTGSTTTCDAPEHVAISGITIQSWEGGNMPQTEDKVYAWQQSKSGFTVLAFTILTFAVSWGLSSALSSAVGTIGTTGISSLSVGAISAGVYAGVAMLTGSGLTDVQSGWAGSTGDGVLNVDWGSMNEHQQRLVQATRNKQVFSRMGTGLSGQTALYSGNCPENYSVATCRTNGLDPGTIHRPDSFSETNTTLVLNAEKDKCLAAIPQSTLIAAKTNSTLAEQLRKQIQICASPQNQTWDTGY